MNQTRTQMVVWENGQDDCDRCPSWSSVFKKECVRGLSQEWIFLQEAGLRVQCLLVTAIATAGHSGRGRCVEWCHCRRDSVRQWTLEWKPCRWLLCLARSQRPVQVISLNASTLQGPLASHTRALTRSQRSAQVACTGGLSAWGRVQFDVISLSLSALFRLGLVSFWWITAAQMLPFIFMFP